MIEEGLAPALPLWPGVYLGTPVTTMENIYCYLRHTYLGYIYLGQLATYNWERILPRSRHTLMVGGIFRHTCDNGGRYIM